MKRLTVAFACVCLALLAPGTSSLAQEIPEQEEGLKVFLDCPPFICDFDHFRREVAFVDYMRDRQDADLHVLVTTQPTGGGGREHRFHFIGLRQFEGRGDTLLYASQQTDTNDERRARLTQTFKMGLMRYVLGTPLADDIAITYRAQRRQGPTVPVNDPWNLWVFRIRVGGEVRGESRQSSYSGNGSLSANRVTEDWKLDFEATGRYTRDRFEFSDGEELISITENYEFEALVVKSLGPHWSIGTQPSVSQSTRLNQDLALRIGPALEYSLYPYSESTRRQITALYSIGVAAFNYEELTIFDQMSEVMGEQRFEISADFEQPWGSINGSVEWSNFLNDFSKHRLELSSRLDIRIFRGLSLDLRGSVARVKDQIYLPREDISDEDILLERKQLGTDFEFNTHFGLSFTFGSIFNNVVNPRMQEEFGGFGGFGGGGGRRR
jgi:hypothetical protein